MAARLLAALLALLLGACATVPQGAPQGEGRFVEWTHIAAAGLPDQRVTIWLPPEYDAHPDRRFPVLYMHDGHNLFDPAKSNFGKVWAVDKTMLRLTAEGRVAPHIVVGIWAPGPDRYRQYLPKFAADAARGAVKESVEANSNGGPIVSDRYLDWIVGALKPRVDRDFRTRAGREDTAIAGSSMGGLMSCYAIAARPDVFSKAACVSSHWPIVLPETADANRAAVIAIWRDWLANNLGEPDGRRIWMDHGTETLDANYAPYQQAIDRSFRAAGWPEGEAWTSRVYPGAAHEENAWAARLPEVLTWLLADR